MRGAGAKRLLRLLGGADDGDTRLFCLGMTVATGLGLRCAGDLDPERSVRVERSDNMDDPAIGEPTDDDDDIGGTGSCTLAGATDP